MPSLPTPLTPFSLFLKSKAPFLLLIWLGIVVLSTVTAGQNLLASPIPLLYLITILLVPSLFFLILTLLGGFSLLAKILRSFLFTPLNPYPTEGSMPSSQVLAENSYLFGLKKIPIAPLELQSLKAFLLFISHLSWLVFFLTLSIHYALLFSFKEYQFILSSTLLFQDDASFYTAFLYILEAVNKLFPFIITSDPLTAEIIQASFNQASNAELSSFWAKWLLKTLIVWGAFPRLVLVIITFSQFRRRLALSKTSTASSPPSLTPKLTSLSTATATPTIKNIESPPLSPPLITRNPKVTFIGEGQATVGFDILPSNQVNPTSQLSALMLKDEVTLLNHYTTWRDFYDSLKEAPLSTLNILLDSTHTPDRGTLRRITSLMDWAQTVNIFLLNFSPQEENKPPTTISRLPEWQAKLTPLLQQNESLYTDLSAYTPFNREKSDKEPFNNETKQLKKQPNEARDNE